MKLNRRPCNNYTVSGEAFTAPVCASTDAARVTLPGGSRSRRALPPRRRLCAVGVGARAVIRTLPHVTRQLFDRTVQP